MSEADAFSSAVMAGEFDKVVKLLRLADTEAEMGRQSRIISSAHAKLINVATTNYCASITSCRLQGIVFALLLGCLAAMMLCLGIGVSGELFIPFLLAVAVPFYCFFASKRIEEIERKRQFDLNNCNWEAVRRLVEFIASERGSAHSFTPLFFEEGPSAWKSYRTFCDDLNRKREKDRWSAILKKHPPLIPPVAPRFVDAVILVGGRRYAEWLLSFEKWLQRYYHTSEQGKCWAALDRVWHRRFAEWKSGDQKVQLERLNTQFKEECKCRRKELREEYLHQFKRLPCDEETPGCFTNISGEREIPYCYGYGHRIIDIRHLQSYIKSTVFPMPLLKRIDAETINGLKSFIQGLNGIGNIDRLVHFVVTFQYRCSSMKVPEYQWASCERSGIREIFVAGEIFACHQQRLLNANVAVASKHMAIVAHTKLERDIWNYIESLCSHPPVIVVCTSSSTEFTLCP